MSDVEEDFKTPAKVPLSFYENTDDAKADASSDAQKKGTKRKLLVTVKAGVQVFKEITHKKGEDWTQAMSDKEKLKALSAPLEYIERLRGILAVREAEIERLSSGKKRGYKSAVMTKPLIQFVCDFLLPLVKGKQGNEYLFTSQTPLGKQGRAPKGYTGPWNPVDYNEVRTKLKDACKQLNIGGKTCTQSFRKSFAMSVFLMSKRDVTLTAKLLGHKDTSTVLAYLRLQDPEMTAVFNKAQDHLFNGMGGGSGSGEGKEEKIEEAPKASRLLSKRRQESVDAQTGLELSAAVGTDLERGMRPFTPQEIQRLLTEAWSEKPVLQQRMRAILVSLASFGCRIRSLL